MKTDTRNVSPNPASTRSVPRAPRTGGRWLCLVTAGLAGALIAGTVQAAAAAPAASVAKARTATAPCPNCGVVESSKAVKQKGEGTGLGAIAGGVLGGVVGNQFGSGSGRTAMTVVGAVGGGVAGHEVEKQVRSETVFKVKVRMEDGSLRTFRRSQSLAVGTPVRAEGDRLDVDPKKSHGR